MRGEGLSLPAPQQEGKDLLCSGPAGPCTHKHTCNVTDMAESRTVIIKRSPFPIKTNSLDRTLRLSFGLTDTNDCVIHPPRPSPLLTAPVSQAALAQSREIVSCLFLNTHLYLTAYWVSVSPNVHYVWARSQACLWVCVSFSTGFMSPARHACHVRLSSPSRRCARPSSSRGDGKGWLAERGVWRWGFLSHPVTWRTIPARRMTVEVVGSGEPRRKLSGGGQEEWKNTISPVRLHCLSSQLVTLKQQSWVII